MRRTLFPLCLLFLALACKSKDQVAPPPAPAPEDQPLREGKYSAAMATALDGTMQAYDALLGDFAKGDTAGIGARGRLFLASLDSLSFNDFQKDTLVYKTALQQRTDTRTELQGLLGEVTLASKRQELNMVSQDLYDLLRTIRYDRQTLFFAEAPSALGEDRPGDWISLTADTTRMVNPYGASAVGIQVKDSVRMAHP